MTTTIYIHLHGNCQAYETKAQYLNDINKKEIKDLLQLNVLSFDIEGPNVIMYGDDYKVVNLYISIGISYGCKMMTLSTNASIISEINLCKPKGIWSIKERVKIYGDPNTLLKNNYIYCLENY